MDQVPPNEAAFESPEAEAAAAEEQANQAVPVEADPNNGQLPPGAEVPVGPPDGGVQNPQ